MSNAVAVVGNKLPAVPDYLKALTATNSNQDVLEGLNRGMKVPPRLSIEGRVFRAVIDGASTPLVRINADGEEEAVQSLNVVVLRSNKGLYKLFYGTKYNPNAEGEAPKCYSYDGITPSPYASEPQAAGCAGCPQNVWGSATTEQGNKTRACSDNKILAVIPVSALKNRASADSVDGQAYSLKVTPSALNRNKEDRKEKPANNTSLTEYIHMLNAYPTPEGSTTIPVNAVATKLFFETDAQYPLLRFKLARFLTEEEVEYVQSRIDGDDVTAIVTEQGQGPAPVRLGKAPEPAKLPAPKNDEDDGDVVVGRAAAPAETVTGPPKRGRPAGSKNKPKEPAAKEAPADVDEAIAQLGALFPDGE